MSSKGVSALLVAAFAGACHADQTSEPPLEMAGGSGGGGDGGAGGRAVVEPTVLLPKTALDASELAVVANARDPQSVEVAAYYRAARGLPAANVVTLDFNMPVDGVLSVGEFEGLRAELEVRLPKGIQALALAWTTPHRVGCMSVTSAFALGYDPKYCSGCGPTAFVDYFDSRSTAPKTDHGLRPTMMLAGATAEAAMAVIDRGVSADNTFPHGDGFLVRTTDAFYSVRWPQFVDSVDEIWGHPDGLQMNYIDNSDGFGTNFISDTDGVLFYFTALSFVPNIDTNTFVPGAVADHMTGYGGVVPVSPQMSALRWLEAGATASYGTVLEPCNYTPKFPDVTVMVPHYFRGETVVEAYWKSVAWPGEGLFIGEPLARPWGKSTVSWDDGTLSIGTTSLKPNVPYELVAAEHRNGPWEVARGDITVGRHQATTIAFGPTTAAFYRLRQSGDE